MLLAVARELYAREPHTPLSRTYGKQKGEMKAAGMKKIRARRQRARRAFSRIEHFIYHASTHTIARHFIISAIDDDDACFSAGCQNERGTRIVMTAIGAIRLRACRAIYRLRLTKSRPSTP